jgi:hypothetical protein
MRKIEVDDEVYGWLEKQVQGFGETPNAVLRRLLGIGVNTARPSTSPLAGSKSSRGKAPKTDLKKLVRAKMLSEGQLLYFHDYQGKKVNGIQARLNGNKLEHKGRLYSMSALTRDVMKSQGYENESYRGPQFWYTAAGISVKDLWDEYLKTG